MMAADIEVRRFSVSPEISLSMGCDGHYTTLLLSLDEARELAAKLTAALAVEPPLELKP